MGGLLNFSSQDRDIPCCSFDYINFVKRPASQRPCTVSRINMILCSFAPKHRVWCPTAPLSCVICRVSISLSSFPRHKVMCSFSHRHDPVYLFAPHHSVQFSASPACSVVSLITLPFSYVSRISTIRLSVPHYVGLCSFPHHLSTA